MLLGLWTALLALAIQLALSFGHVHFDGVAARSALMPLALRWLIPAVSADAPAAPAPHNPGGFADDFCAICSVMRLAGVPATAPALPLPIGGGWISLDLGVELALAASPYFFFRARAPPKA
jgi:hypothetical protein